MPRGRRKLLREANAKRGSSPTVREGSITQDEEFRKLVHSVRGRLKDKGLLKALLADKKHERSL